MEIILSPEYILRSWKESDASALPLHANNRKIAMNLRDGFPFPYTVEDGKKWLKMAMNPESAVFLAIDHEGTPIGSIGLSPFKDVYRVGAEIGYWLSEDYWNKGITSMAVKEMVKYAFENMDIQRIQAGIYDNNKASMKVLENCGFRLEAIHEKAVIKNDSIMDEHLYVIHRNEYQKNI